MPMSFHCEAEFEDSFLNGLMGLKELKAGGPSAGLSHPAGPSRQQSQPPPTQPWASQLFLQAQNICLPHFCREGRRILKLANGSRKRPHGGRQPSARPGPPAWHGDRADTVPTSRPSLQVAFLIRGTSHWVPAGPSRKDWDLMVSDGY